MKTLFVLYVFFAAISTYAAPGDGNDIARNQAYQIQQQQAAYEQQAFQNEINAEIAAAQRAELNLIYSKDPWRRINGATNYIGAADWAEFQGTAQGVVAGGVIFKGKFGQRLTVNTDPSYSEHLVTRISRENNVNKANGSRESSAQEVRDTGYEIQKVYGDNIFYVADFPYPADGRQGYEEMMARPNGYFTYTNSISQVLTIPSFDYGTPCVKLWSAEEIAAAALQGESKKLAAQERALKSNQDAADRGDPYGLMRMGERYRDGDGVAKDLAKAKIYFKKAADAGETTATAELSALDQSATQ